MKSFLFFLVLVFSVRSLSGEESVLSKPLVIGASLADGCNREKMFLSNRLSFDRFLDEVIVGEHEEIVIKGSMFFFWDPKKKASEQLEYASKFDSTVVFAPDFLFWFLYGETIGGEKKRLENLEFGLQSLEGIKGLMVVGTIPDASAAGGGILNHSQIPQKETIAKANAKIKEWVAAREETALLDLYTLSEDLREGRDMKMGEVVIPAKLASGSLQSDKLHPTEKGVRLIALFCLQALQEVSSFERSLVNWEVE